MIEQQATVNGRYRVDQRIGEGGMAIVFRGHDLLLGREVAIKALRPQFAADPGFRTRFEREARAAAGFHHPNIIDIYDVGEEDGTPYIVMEFVRGQTLKEIIEAEAPFHPDDVAALLRQLGAALDFAHERGYVHRDVKPQNILVDAEGHARVVDFGIAKGIGDSDLTATGTGLGTVHYLSPEQASGLMATPASDVYSAGVVAFEMLTGRLPFEADSPVGVAMRHVNDPPPPPSDLLPTIPPAVDAIVLRALAKDPTQRFPSAGALARAMINWRRYLPPRDPTASGSTATVPLPGGWTDRRPDAPTDRLPTGGAAWGDRSPAPPAPRPPARRAPAGGGRLAWLVGLLILAFLAGLIALGVRLSPRLADLGRSAETVAPTSAPAVAPTGFPAPPVVVSTEAPPVLPPIEPGGPPTAAPAAPTAGPALVTVPSVIGLSTDEAQAILEPLGLTVQVQEGSRVDSAEIPEGLIARQNPDPEAQVPAGIPVTVRLSRGAPSIDLEALGLVGQPAAAAATALEAAGLTPAPIEVPSRDVPEGMVVGLDPARRASPGEAVTIEVSIGDKVQIPLDLQGLPLDRAARRLEEAGLRVGERIPVGRATIEAAGLDMDAAGIDNQDVVGVQNGEFGAWVEPNTRIDLVYYDRREDRR